MKIRKATKKDLNDVARILMTESKKKPYSENYTLKKSKEEIKDCFAQDLHIATIENKIIGFIASYITSDNKEKAYIRELWLKPEYQGKGFGKELVKFIEKFYKKKNVKIIRLVSEKSSKAFGFYKKIKYKEYKALVFMEKKL